MTRDTINTICSHACGFSTYMLGLSAKLNTEQREPTEREAAEVCGQVKALAAAVPTMDDGPPATVPQL